MLGGQGRPPRPRAWPSQGDVCPRDPTRAAALGGDGWGLREMNDSPWRPRTGGVTRPAASRRPRGRRGGAVRCFGQALTNWGAPAAGLTKWSGLADVFLLRASGAAPLQGGWWGGALELASSSALGGLGRPRTPQRGNRWPAVPPAGIDWAPGRGELLHVQREKYTLRSTLAAIGDGLTGRRQ